MTEEKVKHDGPGRPEAKIDWKIVDDMLMKGSFATEIAAKLGIHHDTLYKRCVVDQKIEFSAYRQEKTSIGDYSIRQKQFEVAVIDGNTTMLIWLGKQRLGQTDTIAPPTIAPLQDSIDKDHKLMQLEYEVAELKKKLDDKSLKQVIDENPYHK